jgi:hypothetical protein
MEMKKFKFIDGTSKRYPVLTEKAGKIYEDGSYVQICKVLDIDNMQQKDSFAYVPFKYIAGIDAQGTHCKCLTAKEVYEDYPWARKLLS